MCALTQMSHNFQQVVELGAVRTHAQLEVGHRCSPGKHLDRSGLGHSAAATLDDDDGDVDGCWVGRGELLDGGRSGW